MSFRITILGTSGALPAFGRHPSAQLVEIQNRYFLVDCGEGTQMQLMRYDVSYHRINHIFISHLHGDHYLGLMGLLFTMHLQRRVSDLHVYSHRGLDEIIITQLRYSHSKLSYKIFFHPLEEDQQKIIYEDNAITVETIPLHHKIKCLGFYFKEKLKPKRIDKSKIPAGLLIRQLAGLKKGEDVCNEQGEVLFKNEALTLPPRKSRSYAYCSDTSFQESMAEQIKGIDLLYHEATFTNDDQLKAVETKHSTAAQAATMAQLAGVHKLLIGHFSARYKDLTPVLNEAKSIFENVQLALEGDVVVIPE